MTRGARGRTGSQKKCARLDIIGAHAEMMKKKRASVNEISILHMRVSVE